MTEEQAFDYQKALDELEVEISNPVSGYKVHLKGFKAIKEFVKKEKEFWESCKNHQGIVGEYAGYFDQIDRLLGSLQQNKNSQESLNHFNQQWNKAHNLIKRRTTNPGNQVFYSKDPYSRFLFDLSEISTEQTIAAFHMLAKKQYNPNLPDHYIGIIKAYEFMTQDESKIVSRRKSEIKTFETLRNEFEQTTNDTISEFESLKKQMGDWSNEFKTTDTNWKNKYINEFAETKKKRDEILDSLEQTYKEKLRLEAPVQYWQDRAKHYKEQGKIWIKVLSGVVGVLIAILIVLLYVTPQAFHHNLFKLEPEAIKGIILFASIISFGAYLARVCARMTFSSFHLQRDAEEREQLTYVYLALSEGEQIVTEDRQLILQSLFSRADTGLLGDDSAPTMPGVGPILDACSKK